MSCVFIYSKNTLFRDSLAGIVRAVDKKISVSYVKDRVELAQALNVCRPDYVIVDLYSRNFGEDMIPDICNVVDSDNIILVTTTENRHLSYYYTQFCISHFVFAEQSAEEIESAIYASMCGKNGCTFNRHDTLLTPRECEILKLIATGKTSKEIAEMLCISKNTVDTHRNKMLQKLNMANSASLVQFAYFSGLI